MVFRRTSISTILSVLLSGINTNEPEFLVTRTSSPRFVLRITVFKVL